MFTLSSHSCLESTWAQAQTLSLLKNCQNMKQLKQIHALMLKTKMVNDPILATKLLTFCTHGDLAYAQMVFNGIYNPTTFMFNTIIRGYSYSNEPEIALLLYYQMLSSSIPHNSFTFPFLLKACCNLLATEETQQIHGLIMKLGFGSEVFAVNSLLRVYAVCGCIQSARRVFDYIPERDVVSWNTMIDGYMKCGDMEMAYELFWDMPLKNVVSWTSMISGLVKEGLNMEALELFCGMQSAGFAPDSVVIASTLAACAHLGALDQGRWLHAYILNNGISVDQVMGCALVNMYVKCGDMEEALRVFGKLEEKDVSIWTTIIDGLAIHGRGLEALEWFSKMQKEGIEPNSITFTAVLTACSYAGLVDEGNYIFEKILSPAIEHYGCMVDMLGRAGLLNDAKTIIEKMPMRPNAVIWGALLKACRIHGDLVLGSKVGKHLVEKDPDHSGRYVHLASIFAAEGKWEEAAKLRRKMKKLGVPKTPGFSTITLDGIVHEFQAGYGIHPQMEEIFQKWEHVAERLRREGYEPATGDLLLDLENEEKEEAIQQHSEKLAIAFGLINTKPGMPLRVVKNLRVCRDCHTIAKLVSKIYGRDIVMRDRIRFHHFRDGSCSCGDFW